MTFDALVTQLKIDYPELTLTPGSGFYWSPGQNTVYFNPKSTKPYATLSLLHELGHGVLRHTNFHTDFELLQLEVAAWEFARNIAPAYEITVDSEHIEDSLDTYRDWLHDRSQCPTCGVRSLQIHARTYSCYNCQTQWHVSRSRFCRAYRRVAHQKTA